MRHRWPNKKNSAKAIVGCIFWLAFLPAGLIAAADDTFITIEPMVLDEALRKFAQHYDIQIIFPPEDVSGLETPGVSGVSEPAEALSIILGGSGLDFSFIASNFVVVKAAVPRSGRYADSTETATISAQYGESDDENRRRLLDDSEVVGRIVSAVTGKPLSGAVVRIPRLGMFVFTDADGRYRLRGVPAGEHSVIVDYYGMPRQEFTLNVNSSERLEFPIEFGSQEADIILVTGVRSAYENSVNSHRAVDNIVSILAADLSGKFPDDTIAEALRRAPGVSFERDERGGEGEFVSIRGLDARLNTVTINGQIAPLIGVGDGRRVPLDSFQTDSISELVIHKTLLPHHPSAGIGGVIDVKTTAPLDTLERKIAFNVEGRYSGFNDKLGYLVSGRYSDVVGPNDDLGLFAAASFRRRLLRTYQFDVLGSFLPNSLPTTPSGTPISDVSDLGPDQINAADLSRLEDLRLNIFDDQRDVFMATVGAGWRMSSHTVLEATLTYNRRNIDTTRSTMGFEQRDSFTDRNVSSGDLIEPATGRFFFLGESPFFRSRAEVEDQNRYMLAASVEAKMTRGRLDMRYGGGFAQGREKWPLSAEIDFDIRDLEEEALFALPMLPPTDARFIAFDISDPQISIPLVTDAGLSLLSDAENFQFRNVTVETSEARDRNYSAHVEFDYEVSAGLLRDLRWGFEFIRSNRLESNDALFDFDDVGATGLFGGDNDFSISDAGLVTNRVIDLSPIGDPIAGYDGVFEADRAGVLSFRDQLIASLPPRSLVATPDGDFIDSRETAYSGHMSAKLDLNPHIQIVGGVRIEGYRARFRSSRTIEIDGGGVDMAFRADPLAAQTRSTFEILPRVTMAYRPDDKILVKTSMFESVARPRFSTLSRPERVEIDVDASSALIRIGDPNTPNIRSRSYDISLQYFGQEYGFFEVNAYYKTIKNFRISNSGASASAPEPGTIDDLAVHLPSGLQLPGVSLNNLTEVNIKQPIQGAAAEAYGVDFSFMRQFREPSNPLIGLGLRVSGGIQHTGFIVDNGTQTPRESEFLNAPSFSGTAGLWYQRHGINAYAIYSYQGRQLNSIERLFPDEFVQSYSALDLRFEYEIGLSANRKYSAYIAASDVLDSGLKPTTHETIGRDKRLLDDIEFGGREIRFGIQASF